MRPTRSEIELAFKAIPPSKWICCYVRPPNQQQAPCRSLKGQQFFAIAQEIRNLDGKKVLSGDAVALASVTQSYNPQPGPVTVCDSETVLVCLHWQHEPHVT